MILRALVVIAALFWLASPAVSASSHRPDSPGNSGNAYKDPPGQFKDPPGQSKDPPGQSKDPGSNSNAGGNGNGGTTTAPGLDPDAAATPPGRLQPGNSTSPAAQGADVIVELTPDEALQAVAARRAVPLAQLVSLVTNEAGVRFIDASLLRVRGTLVYAIKVIAADGALTTRYYYARSGRPVGAN